MKNQNRLKRLCDEMESKIVDFFLACFNHEKLTNKEALAVIMYAFCNILPTITILITDQIIENLNDSEKKRILVNISEGLKDMLIEALDKMKQPLNP